MFNIKFNLKANHTYKYNLSTHLIGSTYKFTNSCAFTQSKTDTKQYLYKIKLLYNGFLYLCNLVKRGFSIVHNLTNINYIKHLLTCYCDGIENYKLHVSTELQRKQSNIICLNSTKLQYKNAYLYTSKINVLDKITHLNFMDNYTLQCLPTHSLINPFQFIDKFVLYAQNYIFGQNVHLADISTQLLNIFSNKYKKPIANYLLCGPSGTGKTELAKVLSNYVYKQPNKLHITDMSDFTESHSVSKLLGTSPGYIGSDKGGAIVEYITKNPKSVLLFDELEKAHEAVYSVFLQLLDEGILTDSKGVTGDFTKSIIIFTSNLGSQILKNMNKKDFDQIKYNEETVNAIQNHLRPELINRLDRIVIFNPLHLFAIYCIYLNFIGTKTKVQFDEVTKFLLIWWSVSLTKGSRFLFNNINIITLFFNTHDKVLINYDQVFKCL